ncbi:MAG: hypothetical protein HY721_28125 [Planctomycetes bacterium]|nr:hypothetical protein [Planctomycetota bacterium]
MFLVLLLVTLAIALVVSTIVAWVFRKPAHAILSRIVAEAISAAWERYVQFAIYIVGVSGGVRIWDLEKYITPRSKEESPIVLNADRWILEVYRTIVETLQSIAWMLLVFFGFSLVAYVIVRGFELRRGNDVAGAAAPPADPGRTDG